MRGASRVTCDGPGCTAFTSAENYVRSGIANGWRTAEQESGGPIKHLCPKCSTPRAAPAPAPELAPAVRPIPGVWKCPKCSFVLVRTPFDVTTGQLRLPTKAEDPAEACPNDGTTLIQETEPVLEAAP